MTFQLRMAAPFGAAWVFAVAFAFFTSGPFPLSQAADEIQNSSATLYDASGVIGESCKTQDPNHICLALKYVVYRDRNGTPTLNRDQITTMLKKVNSIWNQCDLNFQMEEFTVVDPEKFSLNFATTNTSELDTVRTAFEDPKRLLVVNTGAWNRKGSLGQTSANAWTSLPGSAPYGVVIESTVGTFANIIAHELGHYLNLDHFSGNVNLMNPIIYENSTHLTAEQCNSARGAIASSWVSAER